MIEPTTAIPFTAWEQAVFVALFIMLVTGLLAWFGKQSDKWQKFMFDIDDKWRSFNKEQREENNCAMTEVQIGLQNLTQVTQGLVAEVKEMREESHAFRDVFQDHDDQAKEILHNVKNGNGTSKQKPKSKKEE